jgi:superkiller protein 3
MRGILLWAGLLLAQDLTQLSQQGKQAMAERRYGDAAAIFRQMADAMPENAGLRLNVGLAEFSRGEYAEAAAALDKSTRLDPKLQAAWFLLGLTYQRMQDPAHAVYPLKKAAALDPADKSARFELADAYLSTQQPKLAAAEFEAASRLDPRNAKVLLGLGVAYLELYGDALHAAHLEDQKRWAEAFVLYRKALAASPWLPGAHAAVARIYRETGHANWAAAEAVPEKHPFFGEQVDGVEKRLRQLGESAELHEFLARLREAQQSRAEAAQEWRLAARLAQQERRLQGPLARALWRNREYDEAKPILEGLVRSDPRSPEWNYELGDLLYRTEQFEAALPYLEAAATLPARAIAGRIYLQLGHTEKAIPYLEQALRTDDDGTLHYQLGIAYRRLGRADDARAMFELQRAIAGRETPSPRIDPP